MVTIYGARGTAEAMIARIREMHDRIISSTPAGKAYRANDPELLNWSLCPSVSARLTMAKNHPNSAGCKRHDGRTNDSGCARPGHRLRRGSTVA
jgi:ER-bound oxygenase mpaB/B'/Rubber oxygenase, catalytic domain